MENSRIIVVEDEAIVAMDLERIVRQAGFTVAAIVASGEEAIIKAGELRPDLVLMDIHLTGEIDGIESARRIQVIENVPVIFITAHEDDETMRRAAPLGPLGYLLKPFSDREVQIAVELALYKHKSDLERQLLRDQLAQSQKMEAIGQLAGGVAHDFNNLLTPIIGYAELSLHECSKSVAASQYINEISKSAARAASLTRKLLAFSHQQPIEPKVVDLNEVILNVDSLLRRLIGANIEFVTLPASRPVATMIDPGQLETVLVNLVVNARDALPEGGTIIISTTPVISQELDPDSREFAKAEFDEYVLLSISDNGEGMTADVKAHIFEPYFTTKEIGKGSGLGLSICYGVVKQNGGFIVVDSEPGRGTTFDIYLPRVHRQSGTLPGHTDADYLPTGHETILVVEDEPAVRALVTQIMENQGFFVLTAGNGEEALQVGRGRMNETIHLLLTDVVMPLMSGSQLVPRFEEIHPETKVLYTSGYSFDNQIHTAATARAVQFIEKPFTPALLIRKVREVLDSV